MSLALRGYRFFGLTYYCGCVVHTRKFLGPAKNMFEIRLFALCVGACLFHARDRRLFVFRIVSTVRM